MLDTTSRKTGSFVNLLVAVSMILSLMSVGLVSQPAVALQSSTPQPEVNGGVLAATDDAPKGEVSHRLIVQLQSPSLAEWAKLNGETRQANGKLNLKDAAAQNYIAKLQAEQAAFMASVKQALPQAQLGAFRNEFGQNEPLAYQVVLNALVIEPGVDAIQARKLLAGLPGVKAVDYDYANYPDLYASLPLINAQAAWNNPAIGGKPSAGDGIKVASMDGGAHKDAPMFSGVGYSYPVDYPAGGLGFTANNNGKIIASRVYFRTWDPPSAGDENPWPGTQGTSHGTHTASTAAGNEVIADYAGFTTTISGVAPRAWVMSYRVFYNSITNNGSFYNAEGIAALEDIAVDGADVLNNSWGGGPGSSGGMYDFLDQALINVAATGTFISMSAGNAGPNKGSSDHPSDEYINVANSTTTGTLAIGALNVTQPTPISTTLQLIPFGTAQFGMQLAANTIYTYTYMTVASLALPNDEGCSAYVGTPFTGKVAVVQRGTCGFSNKVYYAEQAGAVGVIIYNNAPNGETIGNMAIGTPPGPITIPSILIPRSKGLGLLSWYNQFPSTNQVVINMATAYQVGNLPDVIASSSSRGPGVGLVLKPEIAAPGTNILAQAYAPFTTGEARHLGYGQVSGTSMAAPHVTGSAALLRQIHPTWPNSYIKSALMTTSKYLGIYTNTGIHAQPLDMGAGRLDLTNAADPGVIVQPTSVSLGQIVTGTNVTKNIWLTSVASVQETYNLSAIGVSVTSTFGAPVTAALPGFTVEPAAVTLDPGESAVITVTFTSGGGFIGDNQGFIVLDGTTYDAHMPAWVRNIGPTVNDVLLIDKDGVASGTGNFRGYYTTALTALGKTYDEVTAVPSGTVLAKYKAVIIYTGDAYLSTAFLSSQAEQNALAEYANQGGIIIASGQDLASAIGGTSSSAPFFYSSVLGGTYLQDVVDGSGGAYLVNPVTSLNTIPALANIALDLTNRKTTTVDLTGAKEVPAVATVVYGTGKFGYVDATNTLSYDVKVYNPGGVGAPVTITAAHIHTGTVGTNGPVLFTLFTGPQVITTTTLSLVNSVVLDAAQELALKTGKLYVNVHSADFPAGVVRGQIAAAINGDGGNNQVYVDEIATYPGQSPDMLPGEFDPYTPLFQYAHPGNEAEGTVAIAHRDQPTLERPGITFFGKTVYLSFGLEGVNNGLPGKTSREALLNALMTWGMDQPTASFGNVTSVNASGLTMFQAYVTSGDQYRWDFGDGSPFTELYSSSTVGHTYEYCGLYNVRLEAVNTWGNRVVVEQPMFVTYCSTGLYRVFAPVVGK